MARDTRLLAALATAFAVALVLAGATSATRSSSTSPLIEHWDGTSWTEVPSPISAWLEAVAAASHDDVWVFGYSASGPAAAGHWDGSSWHKVGLPKPKGAQVVEIVRATALSPSDVWAIGDWEAKSAPQLRPLAEHWDGTRWSIVPTPRLKVYGVLQSVAAVSPKNVWAVGSSGVDAGRRISLRTLVLHWNGRKWVRVSSPSPATRITPAAEIDDKLVSVAAESPRDVWAVGNYFYRSAKHHTNRTLVLHWNGHRWSQVASPSPSGPARPSLLNSVAVSGPTDVWAVGRYSFRGRLLALMEHWDGTKWHVVPSPTRTGSRERRQLDSVASLAPDDVWAVGVDDSGVSDQPLVERWNGSAWTVVPTPATQTDDSFASLAAVSSRDLWAVGVRFQP